MTRGAGYNARVTQMDEAQQTKLEAAAFRRLIRHLQKRKDVQNIDMMILSGFCRNCLSDWYEDAAREQGLDMGKAKAREFIYGMAYDEWKSLYQSEASDAQKTAYKAIRKHD